MKVFNLVLKIMKANWVSILLGFGWILITIPLILLNQQSTVEDYEANVFEIAVFNQDNHFLTDHFVDYIDEEMTIVEVEASSEAVADALFTREIYYALTIPDGYGQAFLSSEPVSLIRQKSNNDQVNQVVERSLTKYLDSAAILLADVTEDPSTQRLQLLEDTLRASEIRIEQQTNEQNRTNLALYGNFFLNYLTFVLLMSLITQFGNIFLMMRKPELIVRDQMASITDRSRFGQTLLACILLAVVSWMAALIFGGVLIGFSTIFTLRGLLLTLNSFISLLGTIALAYLIANIIQSDGQLSFFSIGLSIFLAFASGIFMPRDFVGQTMQNIAQVFHPIWQVQSNEAIVDLLNVNRSSLLPILRLMGIQLLIAFTYFLIAFLIQRNIHYSHRR